MAISQENMDIRLQRLICCIGNLAGDIANSISIGGCYTEKLFKLKILIGYLEALECYSINDEEILASGTIQLNSIVSSGLDIEVFVNGINISGTYTTISTNAANNTRLLGEQINSYQNTYLTTYDSVTRTLTITGKCSNDIITINSDDGITSTITGLSGGVCSTNCITEDQVLDMFEKVSNYCNICFPNPEYNF